MSHLFFPSLLPCPPSSSSPSFPNLLHCVPSPSSSLPPRSQTPLTVPSPLPHPLLFPLVPKPPSLLPPLPHPYRTGQIQTISCVPDVISLNAFKGAQVTEMWGQSFTHWMPICEHSCMKRQGSYCFCQKCVFSCICLMR